MFEPIGYIRSPHKELYHSPRQNNVRLDEEELFILELERGKNYEQALEDIAGFERVWLIWHFHKAGGHWKPKVFPPRGSKKRGVFATRSPHRPNNLGLTCCRLIEIKGLRLTLADGDFIEGTPVFDVKPYIPTYDAFPTSATGWLAHDADTFVPPAIDWEDTALAQVDFLHQVYDPSFRRHIETILTESPLERKYRRIERTADGNLVLAYRSWRLRIKPLPEHNKLIIISIASGYSLQTLPHSLEDIDGGAIHREFMLKFCVPKE